MQQKLNRIREMIEAYNVGKDKPERMTRAKLAKAMRVSISTGQRWVANYYCQPNMARLVQIAAILNCKPSDLIVNHPMSLEQHKEMKAIVKDWSPCELSLTEFKEWIRTDEYGNIGDVQYISEELRSVLVAGEQYEKLAYLRDVNSES